MILCVGEILADMIGTEKDGSFYYERKAGGAPFNVACAAAKFGADTAFIGSVGDDLIGDFLIGFAKDNSKAKTYIQKTPDYNTTLAFVELSGNGERNFCFYRKNTADYRLPEIPADVWKEADIVRFFDAFRKRRACLRARSCEKSERGRENGEFRREFPFGYFPRYAFRRTGIQKSDRSCRYREIFRRRNGYFRGRLY